MLAKIEKWNFPKKILFIPVAIISLCLIGYMLLVLVYSIPTDWMNENMRESSSVFAREAVSPKLMDSDNSVLDNFTDALMLLTASHPNSDNVWVSAANAARYYYDVYPTNTLLYIYQNNGTELEERSYARYWHGYLIFLKPLLVFFTYPEIRTIMMFVQLGLFSLLIIKLVRKNQNILFPTFLMWIFINPIATMLSLQFNTVLVITFLCMLFILQMDGKWKRNPLYMWGVFFLFEGAMTSYFDLLTYPLVSLGVPLILWLSLNYTESTVENLKRISVISVFWVMGYGGMWGSKWLLGNIITNSNVIHEALSTILIRTSLRTNQWTAIYSYTDVIKSQISAAYQVTWATAVILMIFLLVKRIQTRQMPKALFLPYLVIALYPFIWYFALKNHSGLHSFFTYRELAISFYAVSTYIMGTNNI